MDYVTKPTSRVKLRCLAKKLRASFGVPLFGALPVLEMLEKIPEVLPGSIFLVVEDSELPAKTMAQCYMNEDGGFTIEIKESVYDGAARGNGASRGFICHELCHVFLFQEGFIPVFERAFENNRIPAYRSVEWQAKALCGEVMIPYEESRGMSFNELIETYGISQAFATHRRRMDQQEKK